MHKKVLYALFLVCLLMDNLIAQEISAINWTTGLTWQQVKAKAKKENKFIFVDCFTTWCKPCKEMDQKVYSVDSVGKYLNADFISVKVQMDQTKNDDGFVKSWYKTAGQITKEYNVDGYPTLLFFTSSGEIATKHLGSMDPAGFIQSAREAKDPSKQYFVLLKNYKKGKLDDAAKRSLINMAKQLKDTTNYRALRTSYFSYLHALPKNRLYTKENIEFIASHVGARLHVVFDMFYPDGSAVDKVMEKNGYARKVVDEVIMKEKVAPVFNAGIDARVEPNWSVLYNAIAKDYKQDYAERAVLDGKTKWYWSVENDPVKTAIAFNDKMAKYGSDSTDRGQEFILNTWAFEFWRKIGASVKPTRDEVALLTAISNWMEGVVRRGATATGFRLQQWPLYIDTYANLLYKIGRTSDAIKYEELAISTANKLGGDGKDDVEIFKECLNKMKKGEPTWPVTDKKIDQKK